MKGLKASDKNISMAGLRGGNGTSLPFCPDAFYDPKITWNTEDPNISECMQDTLLTYIPVAIVFLLEPLWICYKVTTTNRNNYIPLNICLLC